MDRAGASSFGDVTGEYLALRDRAGYVTDWFELVWVRGPDAVTFLDGLVSQAIAPLPNGAVARSLLLGPQGKLRAPHLLVKGDDEVGLLVDRGLAEAAAGDLVRFKIRVDAHIEIESAPIIALWGPEAAEAVSVATGISPTDGWLRDGDTVVVAAPVRGTATARFVVVGPDPNVFSEAGLVRCGSAAVDAVRIEAGEPVMGIDLDESTIPQEAGIVEGAVDFTKGCYLGQELVARIDSRGRVNRRLRGIRVTTNLIPPIGAQLHSGDALLGTVTSVAESLELRAPIGLALVRREADPGATVTLRWDGGEVEAVVEALPMV